MVDKRGDRRVYALMLDPTVDNSPLKQALFDLESSSHEPQPQSSFITEPPKKAHAQIKREVDEILAGATSQRLHARKLTKSEQRILDQVRYTNELGALAGLPSDDKFVRRLAKAGDIVYVDRAHVGRGKGWVAKNGPLASLIGAP